MSDPLRIVDGAMAFDGGSICLRAMSASLGTFSVYLDWSFESRLRGAPQLFVDDVEIARGSAEEADWLRQLDAAIAEAQVTTEAASGPRGRESDTNVAPGLRDLTRSLVESVRSPEYQSPTVLQREPAREAERRDEHVRELLRQGRRVEAAHAYRRAHPEASPADALAAVDHIAAKE